MDVHTGHQAETIDDCPLFKQSVTPNLVADARFGAMSSENHLSEMSLCLSTTDRPFRYGPHWLKPKRAPSDAHRSEVSVRRPAAGRPWLRWVLGAALALAVGLAGAWWMGWIGGGAPGPAAGKAAATSKVASSGTIALKPEALKTLAFDTITATREPIIAHVAASGQMIFDDRFVAHLRPLSQSRILKVDVQPGQQVGKGAVLMVMDAIGLTDARAKLVDAEAKLKQVQIAADEVNLNVSRGQALVKAQAMPLIQLDERVSTAAGANAAVATAQADVHLQQIQVDREDPAHSSGRDSDIVSPIAGTVLSVSSGPGDVVDDNFVVATVADPSNMVAQIQLYEDSLRTVHAGDVASITTTAYPGRSFEGKLVSVAAQLDPKSNTASARVAVPNSDGALKAGMFIAADVAVPKGHDGLVVPSSVVQTIDGKPVAFVKTGEGRFERRTLVLGLVTADSDEVVSGLLEGDAVVTKGSFDLKAVALKALLGSTD